MKELKKLESYRKRLLKTEPKNQEHFEKIQNKLNEVEFLIKLLEIK